MRPRPSRGMQDTLLLTLCAFILLSAGTARSQPHRTVVDSIGRLQARGAAITGNDGTPVALTGMSLFWSQWGGHFYNADCIRWLRDDWRCPIVRAAVAVEAGGLLLHPDREMAKARAVIQAAIDLGLYVIVDWHDHRAEVHRAEAKQFFGAIAREFGGHPNIIYELYNEPLAVSWSSVIKPYAQAVIDTIREHDPHNLIVVGTPHWSQDVDDVIADPIADPNVAYSFHFYSSTHGPALRAKADSALAHGIPLVVTEYGISEANGNGVIDRKGADTWLAWVQKHRLINCNWAVSNARETSAALRSTASATGNWLPEDLTEGGTIIRNLLRTVNAGGAPPRLSGEE